MPIPARRRRTRRQLSGPPLATPHHGLPSSSQVAHRPPLDPAHLRSLSGLGNEYFLHGYLAKARDVFEGIRALNPTYADAHLALGIVYSWLGRREEALTCFRQFEALEPMQPEVDLSRAEVFVEGGMGQRALDFLKAAADKARARPPDDPSVLQRVAALEALLKLGLSL